MSNELGLLYIPRSPKNCKIYEETKIKRLNTTYDYYTQTHNCLEIVARNPHKCS